MTAGIDRLKTADVIMMNPTRQTAIARNDDQRDQDQAFYFFNVTITRFSANHAECKRVLENSFQDIVKRVREREREYEKEVIEDKPFLILFMCIN